MRLTILTHYYPPEVGAPQARLSGLAQGLSERGVDVTVHTCPPHYPDGEVKLPYRNQLWQEERRNGARVVRTAVAAFPNRGFGRRLVDHTSFGISSVGLAHRAGAADVVVVESPPLFLAVAAVPYAWRVRAPLVLNVADLWPDSAVELGALRSRRAIAAARALERFAYRHAATVTAPTEGIVDALSRRPDGPTRVVQMPPFVDRRRFAVAPASRGEGPLRVLYAGTVGLAHGLETLVEAARLAGPDVVRVTVAGGGSELEAVRRVVLERAGGNVDVLGVVPADRVPQLYENADAAVVLLRDKAVFRAALPTKIFEAMAAARPVVLSAAGESATLVESCGCGLVAPPQSAPALAEALRALAGIPEAKLRAMGDAGRQSSASHDLPLAVDRWQALLENVARSGKYRAETW